MKIITAMVQPFMLSKVTGALEEIDDFPGMTVTDVRGFGREKGTATQEARHIASLKTSSSMSRRSASRSLRTMRWSDSIVKTIVSAAHTGNRGDGKVFVWPVEQAVRIQTGESNDAAL